MLVILKLVSSFLAFENQIDIDTPVHDIRSEALKNFEEQGFPSKKEEAWIESIEKFSFKDSSIKTWVQYGTIFCFLMVLVSLVKQANELNNIAVTMGTGEIGLIKNLGKALFNDFVVPFEISSVLFLSAMVGAVVIGKKA